MPGNVPKEVGHRHVVFAGDFVVKLAQIFVLRNRDGEQRRVCPAPLRRIQRAVGQRDRRADRVLHVVEVGNGRVQQRLRNAIERRHLAVGAGVRAIHLVGRGMGCARGVHRGGVSRKIAQPLVGRGRHRAGSLPT